MQSINERMLAYTQALRGGLALFRASDAVERDEWRTYVETLSINEHFPGIQGLGYAEWVQPDERAAYEARVRAEGFENFTIRPDGGRELYSSIIFLEPFDERNRQAFGYDMFSQETRRSAMELARDTGKVAISGRVTLVQEISSDVQAGFLMYLPYYGYGDTPDNVGDRRRKSRGFVYSPFRMRNLMEGILGPGLPNVRLEIFDGDEIDQDEIMYVSGKRESNPDPIFVQTERMPIGQHHWTLRISSLPEFEKLLDPQKSYIVLIAGALTSLLIFGVAWSFSRTRQRAEKMAVEMTAKLNLHSQELARSNEDLEQFAYVSSHDLKAPLRGIDNLAAWIEEDLGERLEGESRENMRLLRGRVRRLEALLTDLLNYSRARRIESPVETVNLKEAITTTWKLLNTANPLTLDLNLKLESETADIRITALEQVLSNLFSNAIKHHDRLNGTVFVTVIEQPECFAFTIADDGPGIPVEQRERAFQMFQTLRPRDEIEGSGMGLAIIRKIIERIGSSIQVENRPGGRGAQFRFNWPKVSINTID
ncbi:MAG: CHASE domain-containing protein [Kiloniellaceae bacterium]